jgi:hypothetical protein
MATVALLVALSVPDAARAYTAAGDRLFTATILLPQIAPSDELYLTGMTQPDAGGRASGSMVNYDKTIVEGVGVGISEGYDWVQQTGARSLAGWQNTSLVAQYTPIIDAAHEFLLSIGGEREFGGTGTASAGADTVGATTPQIYFGKGLGDAPIAALRPLAIAGVFGYELGDTAARGDQWIAGLAIEYSIPYLESKVQAEPLPDILRATTPIVEILLNAPAQSRPGSATSVTLGPGFEYDGAGFELGAEALIPATRGAGQGLGFTVQLHLSLDYLLPNSLGHPVFGAD